MPYQLPHHVVSVLHYFVSAHHDGKFCLLDCSSLNTASFSTLSDGFIITYLANQSGFYLSSLLHNFRNNECPACRTHCASRRSLRDDPNYDALIATLYPDIEKYEEEV